MCGIMKVNITFSLLVLSAILLMLVAGCTTTSGPTTPTPTPPVTATTAPQTQTSAGAVTIDLVAHNIAFDKTEITVPACAEVTINFDNKDAAVPHNFALYTNSQATTNLFKGQIITGVNSIQYKFKAPCTPGDYYFRCDVHPTIMYGTFKVT